jgi:hypothetical protein
MLKHYSLLVFILSVISSLIFQTSASVLAVRQGDSVLVSSSLNYAAFATDSSIPYPTPITNMPTPVINPAISSVLPMPSALPSNIPTTPTVSWFLDGCFSQHPIAGPYFASIHYSSIQLCIQYCYKQSVNIDLNPDIPAIYAGFFTK